MVNNKQILEGILEDLKIGDGILIIWHDLHDYENGTMGFFMGRKKDTNEIIISPDRSYLQTETVNPDKSFYKSYNLREGDRVHLILGSVPIGHSRPRFFTFFGSTEDIESKLSKIPKEDKIDYQI